MKSVDLFYEPLPNRYRMFFLLFHQICFLDFGGYLGVRRSKISGEKQNIRQRLGRDS